MSTLFLAFVVNMAAAIIAICARYLGGYFAFRAGFALAAWLIYVGVLAYLGIVRNPSLRPPGILFIILPALVFIYFGIVRSDAAARSLAKIPLWIILAMQCFRVGVELFIHQLWIIGLTPRMLTFAGANVDIYIGASAPVIAWIATRGRAGLKLAFAWNILGLLALANIVIRAVLTAPGPLHVIHTEVPNLFIGTFPYTFIPGFFVPLALTLHCLAMRSIIAPSSPPAFPDTARPAP